jgi:hypothetical protein
MFLHTVLFWLRDDLKSTELQAFEAGLNDLINIESVKFKFIGKPASTRRTCGRLQLFLQTSGRI